MQVQLACTLCAISNYGRYCQVASTPLSWEFFAISCATLLLFLPVFFTLIDCLPSQSIPPFEEVCCTRMDVLDHRCRITFEDDVIFREMQNYYYVWKANMVVDTIVFVLCISSFETCVMYSLSCSIKLHFFRSIKYSSFVLSKMRLNCTGQYSVFIDSDLLSNDQFCMLTITPSPFLYYLQSLLTLLFNCTSLMQVY